jgi:hypothetical protein
MLPRLPVANLMDAHFADLIFPGEIRCACSARDAAANSHNSVLRELGVGVGRSRTRSPRPILEARAALREHVVGVVALRPSEQVGRIDTGPVVAAMQDARHIVGNVAMREEVSDPVSAFGLLDANTELAIPTSPERCQPRPTTIRSTGLVNLLPEILNLPWGNINTHLRLRSDVPRRRVFLAPLRLSVGPIIPATMRI